MGATPRSGEGSLAAQPPRVVFKATIKSVALCRYRCPPKRPSSRGGLRHQAVEVRL